jgi:hypothetical protein
MVKIGSIAYIEAMVRAHISRGSQSLDNLFGLLDNWYTAFEANEVWGRIVEFGKIVELGEQFSQIFVGGPCCSLEPRVQEKWEYDTLVWRRMLSMSDLKCTRARGEAANHSRRLFVSL